jgi:hypothetical protein
MAGRRYVTEFDDFLHPRIPKLDDYALESCYFLAAPSVHPAGLHGTGNLAQTRLNWLSESRSILCRHADDLRHFAAAGCRGGPRIVARLEVAEGTSINPAGIGFPESLDLSQHLPRQFMPTMTR